MPLFLNKVSSERTHLPYAYAQLPGVCRPKSPQTIGLNLGEILRGMHRVYRFIWTGLIDGVGDRISKSDYELTMGHDVDCAHLCDVAMDIQSSKKLYDLIHDEYIVEWFASLSFTRF